MPRSGSTLITIALAVTKLDEHSKAPPVIVAPIRRYLITSAQNCQCPCRINNVDVRSDDEKPVCPNLPPMKPEMNNLNAKNVKLAGT